MVRNLDFAEFYFCALLIHFAAWISANFKDHLVGEITVADYLLYWFNKNQEFGYVSTLGLEAPTDVINDVLMHICIQQNLSQKIRHLDGKFFSLLYCWKSMINVAAYIF